MAAPKDNRLKDRAWTPGVRGEATSWDAAQIAILLDIRDQLYMLNNLFRGAGFPDIQRVLKRISKNTAKPRQPKGGAATP